MSSDNEKVVESWYNAFNRKDWDDYADHLADDLVYVDIYGGENSKEDLMSHANLPDEPWENSQVLRVDNMTSNENSVVSEWTWQARHVREFMGVEPSGEVFTFPIVHILDIRDGKIVRFRNMFNVDHLLNVLKETS